MLFHGIQVPNIMDGVDPYTEHPTKPGGEHVYEWVAKGPAVGIYHSHHNAQEQIPDGMFGAFTIDNTPIPEKLKDKGYTILSWRDWKALAPQEYIMPHNERRAAASKRVLPTRAC